MAGYNRARPKFGRSHQPQSECCRLLCVTITVHQFCNFIIKVTSGMGILLASFTSEAPGQKAIPEGALKTMPERIQLLIHK
jgi:hypothetical protein